MSNTNRKRGIRYRFTTSVFAGVAVALGLLWLSTQHGSGDKIPASALARGDVTAGAVVAVVMFVAWSVVAMVRRSNARARERERQAQAPVRGRGRRYAGNPR